MKKSHASLRCNRRGVSPAISTVILTGAVIAMIMVVMSFGTNFLNSGMAENEFNGNKQFMQATGLQMDDIAWTTGRTQTVTYSAQYGSLNFTQAALNYTIEADTTSGNFSSIVQTGILLYNMPVGSYSLGNNFFERVPTSANSSFLQAGSSAPVAQVLCEQKLSTTGKAYARLVVVPTVRMLDSMITESQGSTNYYEFYLPLLQNGTNLWRSQSVTLTGSGITKLTYSNVNQVKISVAFPDQNAGFGSSFFNFSRLNQTVSLPAGSVAEFYLGGVTASIGQV